MKGELKMKTYLFGFVGGGWNRIDAKTKRGAIKAARQKYSYSPNLQVDPNSFRIRTEADERALLALFW